MPPSMAYLLAEDHPASTIPYTPREEMASTNRKPMGRPATTMGTGPSFTKRPNSGRLKSNLTGNGAANALVRADLVPGEPFLGRIPLPEVVRDACRAGE